MLPLVVPRSCLHGTPVVGGNPGNLIMSSTWIFDLQYGYYEVRFGGTAKVLQSYFAVAFIVIWLLENVFVAYANVQQVLQEYY